MCSSDLVEQEQLKELLQQQISNPNTQGHQTQGKTSNSQIQDLINSVNSFQREFSSKISALEYFTLF